MKKCNKWFVVKTVLAIIGLITILSGIAVIVKKLSPNYVDDFEDDLDDDFDDDFFNDEEEDSNTVTPEELEAVKADAEAPAVVPSEETVEE